MTEAPERIVAIEGMGQRYWSDKMGGGALRDMPGIAQAEYVLASVADEDRRKLGVAVDELKRAHEFFVAFKYPSAAETTRAAIAEIEGGRGMSVPGPYYGSRNRIFRKTPDDPAPLVVFYGAFTNSPACVEVVSLLNKGTHFEAMREALEGWMEWARSHSGELPLGWSECALATANALAAAAGADPTRAEDG